MFDNIGKKIKILAVVITWIGIAICVFIGIGLFSLHNNTAGVAVILAGSLLSWLLSFVLYGFGEIVDTALWLRKNGLNYDLANQAEDVCELCGSRQNLVSKQLPDEDGKMESYWVCQSCIEKYSRK